MKLLRYLSFLVALALSSVAVAMKEAPNRPYVQSGADGIFYARCVPRDSTGPGGTTCIYRVHAERDELVDRYEWFTRRGVFLGWSPIAGKVAIMAVHEDAPSPDKQVEFAFYLGGTHLKSWTTADLEKLGAQSSLKRSGPPRADFQVLGCEQVPGTNHYVFTVRLAPDRKVSFDILTGDLVGK